MNREGTLLKIASNVYGDQKALEFPPGEVTRLTTFGIREIPSIGFRADAYRIEATGEIVVAIAGTRDNNVASLIQASGLAGGVAPDQLIAAADAFVRATAMEYGSVTVIGHSSGGLVAQLLAAGQQILEAGAGESELPIREAWGFNNPGAAPFVRELFGNTGHAIPETFGGIHSMGDSRDPIFRRFDAGGENAVMGNSHIGTVHIPNAIHDPAPPYGWALANPFNAASIIEAVARYHPINSLWARHEVSLGAPDEFPEPTEAGFSGSMGNNYLIASTAMNPEPLEEGAEEFETLQTSSPIALDLDGDGVETQGLLAGAFFDHGGDGFAELTGWIGPDDGLLVLDRNGNAAVDHGGELFGNETVLPNGAKAADGYQALAAFDQNADGQVDAGDLIWDQLRIWRDADGNGTSDAGEIHRLADVGVSAIGTAASASALVDSNGNEHRLVGTFTRSDGSAGAAADVWFRVARHHAVSSAHLPVPGDVLALPDLRGYGTVHDLHQAIIRDASGGLKALVAEFVAEPDPARRQSLFEELLFRWTGSAGVAPDSRGPHIDARKLVALERIYGDAFIGIEGTGHPNAVVSAQLNRAFQPLAELAYGQLMVQSHLRDLWAASVYVWDDAAGRVRGDLSAVIDELENLLATDPAAGRVALGEFARTVRGLGVETMVDFPAFRDRFAAQGEDLAWIVDSGGRALLEGTPGDDVLTGVSTADALRGGDGDDVLSGDEGEDALYGQAGADTLIGGADDDLLDGGSGGDRIEARRGDDRLAGRAGDDALLGEAGADVLEGGEGNDSLDGGEGHDVLLGGAGADILLGREDDDTLLGGEGDDALNGNRGADALAGEGGNDTLYGEGGADVLDGGSGNDLLDGGTESDTYRFGRAGGQDVIVDRDSTPGNLDVIALGPGIAPDAVRATREGDDLVLGIVGTDDALRVSSWFGATAQFEVEEVRFADGAAWDREALRQLVIASSEGSDRLTGYSTADTLLGLNGDDTLAGGSGDDWLDGGPGNDTLAGDEGNDTLLGGPGADSLRGHEGRDTLLGGDGDDMLAGDRDDDVLAGDDGHDALDGGGGNDRFDGGAGNDVLAGGDGADTLDGGPGNDALSGDDGVDILRGGPGTDSLRGNAGNDALYGGDDDDVLAGDRDNDTLFGEAGHDRLDGGPGLDALTGGTGNDTYVVDDAGDTVSEAANEGIDTVEASVTYALSAHVEHLTLTGTAPIAGTGNALDNRLTGNAGANTLAGGAGLDWLAGGAGNDTYLITDARAVVIELAGEGADLIQSSVTYALPADVEDLALTGPAPINGTGNALDNRLTGNGEANVLGGGPGNDILEGGAGLDRLAGGAGNDTYVIADGRAVVIELAGEGTDLVQSSVTYTLPAYLENLVLTATDPANGTGNTLSNRLVGNSAANVLSGGYGDDVLEGWAGNDTLVGGPGLDQMLGGPGDDTYVVTEAGDAVVESADEGTDTVESSVTYTLPAPVERLLLKGTGAIDGQGNASANTLVGNAAANRLSGGTGADAMDGGAGNDTYVVDDPADIVVEAPYGGTDAIESAVTYTLSANVEKLVLTGTATVNGTGNALNNTLTGNSAANLLDGGAGADAMAGGAGDDTYVVDLTSDTVQEAAGAGIDTILSSVSYILPANVENISLAGLAAITATGSALGNTLRGNAADNVLDGRTGNDAYLVGRGSGRDTIKDYDLTAGNVDTLAFDADVNPLDLIVSRQSAALRIAVHGTPDRVDIAGWGYGAANRIEVLRAGDGRQLLSTQVDALIQAMASYSARSGLSWDQAVAQRPEEVEGVLAAYWQPAGS